MHDSVPHAACVRHAGAVHTAPPRSRPAGTSPIARPVPTGRAIGVSALDPIGLDEKVGLGREDLAAELVRGAAEWRLSVTTH